jgi:glycosyltransferase involved in cell wall biosynthesis
VAGNNTFYKNRQGVVDVFKIIRRSESVSLKMAGAPPDAALVRKVEASGVADAIEFLQNVSDDELANLYRNAALLLFPSFYEGFGRPPLEAMLHGCPVVCSNAGSLSEVVGAAALTASPSDCETMAVHALRILRDAELRQRLVEAGFRHVRRFTSAALASNLAMVYHAAEQAYGAKIM